MVLPSGYRFFRDDGLLQLYEKETRICKRCDQLYWIDEEMDTYVVEDGYCKACQELIRSRTQILQRGKRKSCPINSKEYIFHKKYHYAKTDKEKWEQAKRSYEEYIKWYDPENFKPKTIEDLKWKINKLKL